MPEPTAADIAAARGLWVKDVGNIKPYEPDIIERATIIAEAHAEQRAAMTDLLPLVADAVSWLRHHHLDAPASTLEEVADRVKALMDPVTQTPPPAAGHKEA